MPLDIVVIGGSAGCIETLRTIVDGFPAELPAAIFVVVHIAPDSASILDRILSRSGHLPASQAWDGQPIETGHIYVARPDHHLTVEDGHMRVRRGPRENRHRPAIDPLFRTVAREFGARVIGVLLSGLLEDGSGGLFAIRRRGGVAIIQDPNQTKWDQMPRRALHYAGADYVLGSEQIGPQINRLIAAGVPAMTNEKTRTQPGGAAAGDNPEANLEAESSSDGEGKASVFACPECHGVLWELNEGNLLRYRCRVGHSYGPESLSEGLSEAVEAALWAAMRALEEKAAMQRRIADSFDDNGPIALRLRDQSVADDANAKVIREMIFQRDDRLEKLPGENAKNSARDQEPPEKLAS